jgi:hypothetical protein
VFHCLLAGRFAVNGFHLASFIFAGTVDWFRCHKFPFFYYFCAFHLKNIYLCGILQFTLSAAPPEIITIYISDN